MKQENDLDFYFCTHMWNRNGDKFGVNTVPRLLYFFLLKQKQRQKIKEKYVQCVADVCECQLKHLKPVISLSLEKSVKLNVSR